MALSEIKHIVFCMLENRSFDHMLGYLSLTGTLGVEGFKRDDPEWLDGWTNMAGGKPYPINPLGAADYIDDPPHGYDRIKQQITTAAKREKKMGGFVAAHIASREPGGSRKKKEPLRADPGRVMGYYTADAVPTFDFFARNYCVCDHWFSSLPLGTQANRLMAMAGETKVADNETGVPYHRLVYEWLKAKDVKWRVYQSGNFFPFFTLMDRWAFKVLGQIFSPKDRFTRLHRFADDWRNAQSMPSVIFIEPEYSDGPKKNPNDDHPPLTVAGGQKLLRDLYETLISNEERWSRTLLIVTYDEHGGFFDHVEPLAMEPMTIKDRHITTTGLRVPAFLVSPWVDPGTVYRPDLDHTSFLQLLAERFSPPQGYSLAVNSRQGRLSGRISAALRDTPRPGPPPAMPPEPETKAAADAAVIPLSDAPRAPDTPTSVGFDRVARRLKRERSDLLGYSDMADIRDYLRRPPPIVRTTDHIDEPD